MPADANTVVLNVTVTDPTAGSYLTVWPQGSARPTASSVNWVAGQTIPNTVTVGLNPAAGRCPSTTSPEALTCRGRVGYFEAATGELFHPLSPVRILDSPAQ